ncbi:MAG TPA: isochorismatase, partial [Thermoanaerobaculia bacterium]|nr:isochorismatase [Thermoanaerobaculia bacterium]
AWTIEDLLGDIRERDPELARKVYLLEDCTSPVVIPGAVDFTAPADEAFARFAAAGMHAVRSSDPIAGWPK